MYILNFFSRKKTCFSVKKSLLQINTISCSQLMPNKMQTSKMAARQSIATPERLLGILTLHWAEAEA